MDNNERPDMKTQSATARRSTSVRIASKRRRNARKSPAVIELVPSLLKIKTILVPLDFSATSAKALAYAIRMADQFGSKIILLNVIEPIATPDLAYHPLMLDSAESRAAAQKAVEAAARKAHLPDSMLKRITIRHGTPFAEIADAARTLRADLIIITTHGYTGLKHVFMGSTAERVVRHAPCPVLVVREKEHEFV